MRQGAKAPRLDQRLVPTSPWRWLVPDRTPSQLQGQIAALLAVGLAGLLRAAILPLLGAEASFLTAVPAVLLVTIVYGRGAAVTSLAAGAALDLLFSVWISGQTLWDALPRFLVWLFSATLVVVVALGLRAALLSLRFRERELEAASNQLEVLVRELEHRGRNALAMVQAISNDTAQSAASLKDYQRRFSDRLAALSASYATFTQVSSSEPELLRFIKDAVAPFGERISIEPGEPCRIRADTTVPLALALHELATNASKYGALSAPTGQVVIKWTICPDGSVDLSWTEIGGPAPAEVAVEGYGSKLLRKIFGGADGRSLRAERRSEGLAFQIRVPCLPGSESPKRKASAA
jgi:two-component sensor histidine kinase